MPELPELERRITATKAALDGARAVHAHSPNAETQRIVERTCVMLNDWLDMWARRRTADQIVDAY